MNNEPLFFEGAAVVTNIIATGACFAVTSYGDVYIPPKTTRTYGLKHGQHLRVSARKNYANFNKSCQYIIVDVLDTNPNTDEGVAAQIEDATVIEETAPSFTDLTDVERWEAVIALSEEQPMFDAFDFMDALGVDHDDNFDAVMDYLTQCVSSSALWQVQVTQGMDEDPTWFAEYFILHPELKFKKNQG